MNYDLSQGLSRILRYSRDEALRLHSRSVGSAHLLLGILHESEGKAAAALHSLCLSTDVLRRRAEQKIAHEEELAENEPNHPEMNEESTRILRLCLLEARLAGSTTAESEHLLLAMLHDRGNSGRTILNENEITYEKVAAALNLKPNVRSAFGVADEDEQQDRFAGSGADGKRSAPHTAREEKKGGSDTPVIDNFSTDLTLAAKESKLDPVVGRQREIERIAQILSRRKKNNPILIGEPGVGKSAVVEGLAQLIAAAKVPRGLAGKRIVALDMAAVVAGTQYRGQFEERLRRLIGELKAHPEIVLFIDEIHTMVGAGSAPGSLDAANILKPALARGEVQCIGATTVDEYRKTIEKDGALERRFQKIMLEPATAEETLTILRNIKDKYEEHHNVTFTDDALEACVRLTERYVTDRALPDKAIDALDEAGSRTHMVNMTVPKEIEDKEKEINDLRERKNEAAASQHYELAANLRDTLVQKESELKALDEAWRASLKENRETVTGEHVAAVVSMMTGIPVQRLRNSESVRLKGMRQELAKKVIAQDRAIERLTRAITRNRIGLKDPNRPIGTFMFVGPTGVGKTHLVKTLAEFMFGSADALIRVDMSEYVEKYSTSRLVGAPPGYVGYEEGGQLTEKVRRHPYSIVLLDEIEKAHGDVFNILLQVMDEGRLTDGNGTTVDFRNTVIVMTSNSGTRQLREFGTGVGFTQAGSRTADARQAEDIVKKALQKQFAPEFLNRLDDIIMFDALDKEAAGRIADLELTALAKRIGNMGYHLDMTPEARAFIVNKGFDPRYGARSLKRAIQSYVEDPICETLMEAGFDDERENAATRIAVGCKEGAGELTVQLTNEDNNNGKTD